MSGFGIFLLMAALLIALLALIKFFSWLTLVQERGGFSAMARAGVERYAVVKRLHEEAVADYVRASGDARTDKTDDTDGPSVSAADQWLDRLEVDRTKTAVIDVLVYSGWTVGEVRAIIKGDNATIGTEVAAARQRLGMGDDPPRMLKVREGANEREIVMEPKVTS